MKTNTVYNKSSLNMAEIPDNSIDLIITSPPYNVNKEYENFQSDEEYQDFINQSLKECYRVLKPDGRVCWNVVGTITAKGRIFSPLYVSMKGFEFANIKLRDIIVWDQLNSENDTAWGSWASASSPHLRHKTEFILIGFKEYWKKQTKGESDITRDEFLKLTLDIWQMPTETSYRKYHPAPFPEILVANCLKLFSYKNDIILDPFAGTGTTLVVAKKLGRQYIGYEINKKYMTIINRRLAQEYLF